MPNDIAACESKTCRLRFMMVRGDHQVFGGFNLEKIGGRDVCEGYSPVRPGDNLRVVDPV
jgi:hypothetical protein